MIDDLVHGSHRELDKTQRRYGPKTSHGRPYRRAEDKCFRNRHVQDSLGPELFQQSVELSEVPTPTDVFSRNDDGLVLAHGCSSSFNGGLAETD